MTIAIFGNARKTSTPDEVAHLLDFMQSRGVDVVLSAELRHELELRDYANFSTCEEPIDFALSVGGDGTFLTTAALIGNRNIPIVGINIGHKGFLADVQTSEVDVIMDQLIRGDYTIEQRSLLNVTCDQNIEISMPNALNEIAILKQGLSSMLMVNAVVNNQPLTTYKADGLVIATPTGSTAYNMSIGGPILMPQARGILLSPIASHSLTMRPIVIPDDWEIDLDVHSRNGSFMVSVDGRSQILNDNIHLHIAKAPYTIKVVQVGHNSFIQSLKDKLLWGAN